MIPIAAIFKLSLLEELSKLRKVPSEAVHGLSQVEVVEVGNTAVLDITAHIHNCKENILLNTKYFHGTM